MNIRLDDQHRYWLGDKRIPGVSEIIRLSGLATDYFGEAAQRKRVLGTYVHKAIALDLAGQLDKNSLAGPVAMYFAGYELFKQDFKIKPLKIEQIIASNKWGFAGTLDFIGNINIPLCLVDWKTSVTPAAETDMQLSAYSILAEEIFGLKPVELVTVHLNELGKYKIVKHKENRQDFLAALLVAKRLVADKFGGDYDRAMEK